MTLDKNGSRVLNQILMLQYRGNNTAITPEIFSRTKRINNFMFEYSGESNETVFPSMFCLERSYIVSVYVSASS